MERVSHLERQVERPNHAVHLAVVVLVALLSVDLGPFRYPQLESSRFLAFLALGFGGAWFARATSLAERTASERSLIAAFGWLATVSLVASDPLGSAVISGALFGTLLLGMHLGRSFDRVALWMAVTIGATAVLGVAAALGSLPGDKRWIGLSEEPNALAVTAALTVAASFVSTSRYRAAWIGVIAGGVTLFATNAAIPALGASVGIAVWLARGLDPLVRRLLSASALVLVAAVATAVVALPTEALPGDGYNLETLNERTGIWSYLAERVSEAPFLGSGPRASHDLAALGVFDQRVHWGPDHAHNAALEMAVAGGLPAAALFVVGLGLAIRSALTLSDAATASVAITLAILAISEPLVRDPTLALLLLGVVAVAGPKANPSAAACDHAVARRLGIAPTDERSRSDNTEN